MSEFNIEDLDVLIARSREGSLAQLLALQLKCQIRKSEQLAAENAGLKSFGDTLQEIKSSLIGGGHGHMAKADMQAQGAVLDVVLDAFDDIKTPATDAYLAGIKADGVDSGIETIMTMLNHQAPGVSDAINVLRVHSSELREGAEK